MGVLSIRIGFGIVAIIAAIEMLQTQAVLNAILLFGAAGIVPGTDIVLSPEATMWSLGGVLVASVLLIFHKDIIVAFMPSAPTDVVEMPEEVVAVEQTVAAEPEAEPHKRWFAFNLSLPRAPHVAAPTLPHLPKVNLAPLLAKTRVLTTLFVAWLRTARLALTPIVAAGAAQARYSLHQAALFVKRAFRASAFHLRQFDQWATAKIQKRDDLSEIQKLLRESTKVLGQWLSQARAFIAQLPRKFDR